MTPEAGQYVDIVDVYIIDDYNSLPTIPGSFRFAPGETIGFKIIGHGCFDDLCRMSHSQKNCALLVNGNNDDLDPLILGSFRKWSINGPVVLCLQEQNDDLEKELRDNGVREVIYEDPPKLRTLCRTLIFAKQWRGGTSRARQAAHALKALDRIPMGVIFVNQDMQVLHINGYGRFLNNKNDCFSVTSGGNLYLKDSNQTQLISQVVELVATNNTPESLEDMVFRVSGKEEDYIVSVAEVGTDRGRKGAALFINSTEDSIKISIPKLRKMFSLTNSEGDLVYGLLQGKTVRELAESRSVSQHTVRNQLKNIFLKTNVSGQTGLIKKIMSTPSLYLALDN